MNGNVRLRLAWGIFLATVVLFIAGVEWYHRFQKERSSNCQYRILIDESSIIETEETNSDAVEEEKTNPDEKFYEQTEYGSLPKIASDGTSVFDEYAACVEISSKKALRVVVLVEEGDGINKVKLNGQKVAFVVPHYLDHLEDVVKTIRENGHEFFIQIPTQSSISADKKRTVSPFLANSDVQDTLDKLFHLLASARYAVGIANISPTLLTKSRRDMTAIFDALAKRGLAFLDLEQSNDLLNSVAQKSSAIYINSTVDMFAPKDFDFSKLKDGDIIAVRLDRLDDLVKALPSDWTLTPVSASVKR